MRPRLLILRDAAKTPLLRITEACPGCCAARSGTLIRGPLCTPHWLGSRLCGASCRTLHRVRDTRCIASHSLRMRQSLSAMGHLIALRVQPAPVAARGGNGPVGLDEQFGELFGDGAAEFFGVDDGDGAAVVARDVVADADRDQFDRRAGFDLLDDMAQMA